MHDGTVIRLALIAACFVPVLAFANPPFLTDDPEPTDYRHWEIDTFSTGGKVHGELSGIAAGIEADYGIVPDVEIHLLTPVAYDKLGGSNFHYGYGDTELGVKYRFITPGKDDWWPEVAVASAFEVPTGDAQRGLGTTGHGREFLPVWVQKDFGKWTVTGGGGFWNNPGGEIRNYWLFGGTLQRKITDNLSLGAELFHQTADSVIATSSTKQSTGFNLGVTYDFSERYHLLFSAGKGLQNAETTNAFSYYLGLQQTF